MEKQVTGSRKTLLREVESIDGAKSDNLTWKFQPRNFIGDTNLTRPTRS